MLPAWGSVGPAAQLPLLCAMSQPFIAKQGCLACPNPTPAPACSCSPHSNPWVGATFLKEAVGLPHSKPPQGHGAILFWLGSSGCCWAQTRGEDGVSGPGLWD